MHRRWAAALLAASLIAAAPAAAQGGGPSVTIPDEPRTWRERAALVMDHGSLGPMLREEGARPASTAEIYLAEIVPGVDQPALVTYDAYQGAFSQDFWPASSVKLLAAVGALEYVGTMGFTGDAALRASWLGERTLRSIYEPAIVRSDNRSYDLLMRVAGLDFLNLEFLPSRGLGSATMSSSFTDLSVTVSPEFALDEWTAGGPLPLPSYLVRHHSATVSERRAASRAYRSNNLDLFDLGEVVRRVMLHSEVPAEHRFALSPRDVVALQAALCAAEPAHYQPGAIREWGDAVEVCGKSGWWERFAEPEEGEGEGGESGGEAAEPEKLPPACTDVALISDPASGRRVLLAATGGCGGDGLASLAGPALRAAGRLDGTPLQLDAGIPMQVSLSGEGETLVVVVAVAADGVQVRVDRDGPVAASPVDGGFRAVLPLPADGPHLLVIEGLAAGEKVAYRAVDVDVAR